MDDDLESQYLQAKKAEMQFMLEVPGKGLTSLHYKGVPA